jgi:hypothetical protein
MTNEFKSHPPLHITGIADKWERDNKTKFTHLKGFYLAEHIIITSENFQLFNFEYLFADTFEKLKMIFVSDKTNKQLEKHFIKELNNSRSKNNLLELSKAEIAKISIKTINVDDVTEDLGELMIDGDGLSNNSLAAFFIFSMKSGNQIGFVGFREDDNEKDYILNLKYGDAKKRLKIFDEEWKNID